MSVAINSRSLRQQLGWSAAELARHLGVRTESVHGWEQGTLALSPEVVQALKALMNFAESNARKMQSQPMAEACMKDLGVEQGRTDLLLENLDV